MVEETFMHTILPEWLAVLCASLLLFLVLGVIALDGHTAVAGAILIVYALGWLWAFWPTANERSCKPAVIEAPASDSRMFLEAMRRYTPHQA